MTKLENGLTEYYFWWNTTFLGRKDIVKNENHPERINGWLQAKIRPCSKHQTADLIWYGSCPDCFANYEHDNDWMWDL